MVATILSLLCIRHFTYPISFNHQTILSGELYDHYSTDDKILSLKS